MEQDHTFRSLDTRQAIDRSGMSGNRYRNNEKPDGHDDSFSSPAAENINGKKTALCRANIHNSTEPKRLIMCPHLSGDDRR